MDTPNQAVWADGVGCPFRIDHADMPVPDADEVIIRNHAIAINPLDWKIRVSHAPETFMRAASLIQIARIWDFM